MTTKLFQTIGISLTCLTITVLTACTPNAPAESQLFKTDAEAEQIVKDNGGVLMHLNDFKDKYMTMYGVFFPVRERSYTYAGGSYQMDPSDWTRNNLGYFSVDSIPTDGEQVYIRGRVITDDAGGNFYKSMVIQEIVDGKQQVLRISVDASNLGGQFLVGQEIMIHVNGLSIGKYSNQPQLCVPSYNDNIYAQYASQKVGWAPGRIPAPLFMQHVTLIGKPDMSKLVYDELSISSFTNLTGKGETANQKYFDYDGRLVRITGVWFTGQYENQGSLDMCDLTQDPNAYVSNNSAITFAPNTMGLGFPQSRIVSDGSNVVLVSSSEYAKFAAYYLPGASYGVNHCSDYVGSVSGILGHYTDNGRNDPDQYDWSITLRDFTTPSHTATVEDIVMKHKTTGEAWIPQEYKAK
ncbi:MAG: DUF5689 domain-containing protein [Paludibacteraceae bacterium]|nr:DUF5689 domain-containing protein [Paludibacteraceae bacterium]